MKKLLLLFALCSVATLAVSACKKKERSTKVVHAKADAHETKAYKHIRGDK